MALWEAKQPIYNWLASGQEERSLAEMFEDCLGEMQRLENLAGNLEIYGGEKFLPYVFRLGSTLGMRNVGSMRQPSATKIADQLERYREYINPWDGSAIDVLRAQVEKEAGRPELALEVHLNARKVFLPDGQPVPAELAHRTALFFTCLFQTAEIQHALRQPELAAASLRELLSWMDELPKSEEWKTPFRTSQHSQAWSALGACLSETAQLGEIPEHEALEAFESALDYGDIHVEARNTVLTRRARLHIRFGRLADAESDLVRAQALQDGSENGLVTGNLSLRSKLFRDALLSRTRRARGATGADLAELRREMDLSFQELLRVWDAGQAPGHGGTAFLQYDRTRYAACAYLELLLGEEPGEVECGRAIEFLMALSRMGRIARDLQAKPGGLQAVRQHLLGPGDGVLLSLHDEEWLYVFALDLEGASHHVLDLRAEPIEASIGGFERRLFYGGGSSEDLLADGEELYARLFPGAFGKRVAGWKRIFLVDREMLFGLPFEGLAVDGEWLAKTRILAELPSLPVGLQLADQAQEQGLQRSARIDFHADVRAPVDYPVALPPPGETGEWPDPTCLLSGGEATLENLRRQLEAGESGLLNITGHGNTLDGARLGATSVVLRDGQRLGPDDLAAMPMRGVVVLNVCDARDAKTRLGNSAAEHLGGGALRGGATTVVCSNQVLYLEECQTFGAAFTAQLAAGESSGTAHRSGVNALDQAGYGPSSWAKFTLLGSPSLRLAAPSQAKRLRPVRMLGMATAGLLLVGLGWMWRRRRTPARC